ncbi:phenylacetate--CoA ligase family protein [Streptomyces huiliensis]|uniref:phenylacetate--CoA ligase family protein n=1 Tax=Streptomyces huiliensis TaxID=2876027 RepID=UPI001CBCE176|nr:AMP-binding protein [Streptomyces huiliensis]MBZ4317868.1 AMP-binding protein [Streptomyces huiliensis]
MTGHLPQLGDWHSIEALLDGQDEQLARTLSWAARSPFYARRFSSGLVPASATDLAALELTGKQDLRDNYPFGLLAVERERLATYHESSGTAGQPTPSYYTAEDWQDLAERFARKHVGITAADTLLVRTPYALLLTGHLAHAAARSHGATVVPGDNRSLATPCSRIVRALHDLEVTLTWSMPTECLLWGAGARARGWEPSRDFPALRALFVGGEPLSEPRRRRISRLWGVPVVEEYGSTETGTLAGECPEGRLHLWADRARFEVYDPATGLCSPQGRGQLVVTTLYRQAMPLVRYNLEDTVEVSYEECPCGWHLPTVTVLGRSAFGYSVAGRTVTQHRLEELVFSLPEEDEVLFWRARAETEVLRVQIEAAPGRAAAAATWLTNAVRSQLDVPVEVSALQPGELLPAALLRAMPDVVKPRSLFGPNEDWDKALLYQ